MGLVLHLEKVGAIRSLSEAQSKKHPITKKKLNKSAYTRLCLSHSFIMEIVKLLVDFGMVIIIWMTQLIVYPGFNYYNEAELIDWHRKYTKAISILVIPLITAQVSVHIYDLWVNQSIVSIINTMLIAMVWIITFGGAVPLHNQITRQDECLAAARKLVKLNWYRTILWNVVFGLSVFEALRQ